MEIKNGDAYAAGEWAETIVGIGNPKNVIKNGFEAAGAVAGGIGTVIAAGKKGIKKKKPVSGACFSGDTLVVMAAIDDAEEKLVVVSESTDMLNDHGRYLLLGALGAVVLLRENRRRKTEIQESKKGSLIKKRAKNEVEREAVQNLLSYKTQRTSGQTLPSGPAVVTKSDAISTPVHPSTSRRSSKTVMRRASAIVATLAACLLVMFTARGGLDFTPDAWNAPQAALSQVVERNSNLEYLPIEQVEVGHRVHTAITDKQLEAAIGSRENLPWWDQIDVDSNNWSQIDMVVDNKDGQVVHVELLRPIKWIEQNAVSLNSSIQFTLPSVGVDGLAKVLNVKPCPSIQPGNGSVVTGKFVHQKDTLSLVVEGIEKPIKVTSTHHIYSVDRNKYVPASFLEKGERLQLLNQTGKVESISRSSGIKTVYNLEIHGEHVFRVTTNGMLVHNDNGIFPGEGPHVIRHYTDESGFNGFQESGGVLLAGERNRVYITPKKLSPEEAVDNLFAGNPNYAGHGDYVIQMRPKDGLKYNDDPSSGEYFIDGAIRDKRHFDIISAGKNEWKRN